MDTIREDEQYIARCIQLAKNGICHVAPNPMVGAVVVRDGKIIGEGYHVRCGESHAEVHAIASVKDPSLLASSTLYVSLEPCAHYGKTPPCAKLIIEKRIPRVVVGCMDPFSLVAGRGIRMLRDAGVEVRTGVLEEECRRLIRRFTVFNTWERPYVVLKWAESADGFLDRHRAGGRPAQLSSFFTKMLVHKRRSEVDAILVGTRTALLDDPSLTVRDWAGKHPLRVVIDKERALPSSLQLFADGHPTLCVTSRAVPSEGSTEYVQLDFSRGILPQLLPVLYERGLQTLLVEGGAQLLQSFIDARLWDEAYVEKAPVLLSSGVKAPLLDGAVLQSMERWHGRWVACYSQASDALTGKQEGGNRKAVCRCGQAIEIGKD